MKDRAITDEQEYRLTRADEYVWERSRRLGLSRRRFLQLLAAGGMAAAMGGEIFPAARGAQAAPADSDVIVKPTPPDLFNDYLGRIKEMRWEAMRPRGYLVPNELFFIVDSSRTVRVDAKAWRLRIEGSGVLQPREFTYDEILGMPSTSVVRFVECGGNGRRFFVDSYGKPVPGAQFNLGLIGVAEWTGVPLREVLERAGLRRTARDVMPEGLDEAKVRRPFPIGKALADDTLIVYAMNGQVLPSDHGFPVRVLVPGWIGVANVKWVGRIEVSEQAIYTRWNTESYVMIGPDYKPEPPAKGHVLTVQNVKSAFELPWNAELATGRQLLRGRSWSGQGKIARVDVSVDRGVSWQPARLREPNIPQAWVRWDVDWEARPGTYSLRARAMDERGNTQPVIVPWNEQGYLYNAVVSHPVGVRA